LIGEMAAITGTFVAGLMFGRTPERERIETGMRVLAYGFFVPIFFISIGLTINIRNLPGEALWEILLICLVAVVGKIFGAGLGAKLAGFNPLESLQLGIGMISRGEVGLIVAQVGLSQRLISNELFSAVIAMVLFTTLITPLLLRALFHQPSPAKSKRPLNSDKESI
jgi:Kef-type K+ transport system membrane component KefB